MTAGQPQDLIRRKVALLQEAEISLYSIEAGLAALEKNRPYAAKPFYFVWFILLSTGFERLMKIIICLHEYETTGAFPTRNYLARTLRHDLISLRDEIVRRCYTPDYLNRAFGRDDYNFITADNLLNATLSALNDFGNNDRYIFMDGISQPEIGNEWPKGRWEELERIALTDQIFFQLLQDNYPELKRRANIATKVCIERFTRALTRLFVFGNLGDLARSQYALIADFAGLEDSSLGHKEYQL